MFEHNGLVDTGCGRGAVALCRGDTARQVPRLLLCLLLRLLPPLLLRLLLALLVVGTKA